MAYFRKRENGWEYRISYKTPDGKYKQKSKSGFKTKAEATRAANEAERLLIQGVTEDNNSPFEAYFIRWAELYKKPKITPTTWRKYEYTHKKIQHCFHQTKLKSITSAMYQQAVNDFRATHSWQTVKMFNTHVRQCVKMALHEGIIAKDFTIFTIVQKDKDKDKSKDYLELDEYLGLIAKASSQPLHKSPVAIYLIAVTGLRFSEAMGIDLADIDREHQLIHVTKTYKVYGASRGYAPTKNPSSVRDVPISQETIQLLDEYIATFSPSKRLFEGLSNTAVNKSLKRMVKRDVHVHSLRHTYVSYLISKGVDVFAISKLIGHSNLNTTLEVYAHLLDDQKQKNNDKIRKLFGADLGQAQEKPL